MTFMKTTLITSVAMAAFAAAPALANHHEGDDKMKHSMEKSESMMKDGKKMMKDGEAMMDDGDAMMKENMSMETKDMMHESMTMEEKKRMMENMSAEEKRMMMKDGKKMHDGMHPSKVDDTVGEVLQEDAKSGMMQDRAIAVPTVNNPPVTTVNCPAGSTAQPNGTCMLDAGETLDYQSTTMTDEGGNMDDGSMMDSEMSKDTPNTGLYTTEGKPYKGTLNPAEDFGS